MRCPIPGFVSAAIDLDITSALGDSDGSEVLSVTIAGVPAGATLSAGSDNGNGSWTVPGGSVGGLTITPPADSGADFTLQVSATATETDPDTLAVTTATTGPVPLGVTVTAVADAPTLATAPAAGDEDTAIALDITSALGDSDGSEVLSVTIAGVPTGATLSAGTDNGNGSWTVPGGSVGGLTITPPADSGADFTLQVSATAADTDPDTGVVTAATSGPTALAVTVTAVADAPELATVTPASGAEDTAIALDLSASLGDTDGSEVLSVTVSGVPTGASLSTGTDNGDGSWTLSSGQLDGLTITPPQGSGADFTLQVTATATETDPDTLAVTTATTGPAPVVVTLDAVADAPELSTVSPVAGAEDTAIPLQLSAALPDGAGAETLSVTIAGVPTGATLSAGTDNGDGSWTVPGGSVGGLTITPPADSGADLTLQVSATATETDPDTLAVTTATTGPVPVGVTVTAVADAPTLATAPAAGAEDTAIALDITSALGDSDGSEVLSVTIAGVPSGATLSAGTDNGDGSWTVPGGSVGGLTITPPAGSGTDFTLQVSATATETDPDTLAVTTATTGPVPLGVAVTAVADAPTLSASAASGDEDTAIALDITSALGDTDGSEVLSVTIAGVPTGATLSAGTDNGNGSWTVPGGSVGGLTITPPADSGADFTLQVSATATETDPDTLAVTTATTGPVALGVTVTAVADAPTLATAPASGSEDTAIALDITSALGDTDGSEVLSVTIAGVPTGATLSAGTDNGNGS